MKNSVIYTTLLLMLISIAACRCDKQEALYPNGSEMYRYVFRDTSTWVYRNTTTNIYDTVTMYQMFRTTIRLDTSDKCTDLKKEVFFMKFRSSLNSGQENYYFIDYNGIRINGTGDLGTRGHEVYSRLNNVGDSTFYTKYLAFYNSMNIENHTIINIRKYELLYTSEEFPDKTFLYWSPSLGLVRKEIINSGGTLESWDLHERDLQYYQ